MDLRFIAAAKGNGFGNTVHFLCRVFRATRYRLKSEYGSYRHESQKNKESINMVTSYLRESGNHLTMSRTLCIFEI